MPSPMSTPPDHAPPSPRPPAGKDEALIERKLFRGWCEGDERQGAMLLRRFRVRLLDYFRHCPPDLAEDLAHDTLLAFVEGRDELRNDGALRCYLYRIARRMLIRTLYRGQRRALSLDEEIVSPRPSDGIDLSRIDVQMLLRSNSSRYMRTVVEHYLGGWSTPEIASAHQMEVRAVRNQLRNGLARLRRAAADTTATDPAS